MGQDYFDLAQIEFCKPLGKWADATCKKFSVTENRYKYVRKRRICSGSVLPSLLSSDRVICLFLPPISSAKVIEGVVIATLQCDRRLGQNFGYRFRGWIGDSLSGWLFVLEFGFFLSRWRKKLMSFANGEDFLPFDITCMNVFVLAFENFNAVYK